MSQYLVGIDLGTTHTVVAYAPLSKRRRVNPPAIELLQIEQLIAPGEVAALPLLPSARYHAAPGELAASACALPWPQAPDDAAGPVLVGRLARQLGAQVPGRLVASAKSWLSHPGVDRQAAILPWGAPAEVPKVSPVAASASYLAHVRAAWNHQFPASPLEQQEIVLTVPASFDEAARALTLSAAREAGLPRLRLLEEPQAAFYDWLFRHRKQLAAELAQTRLVLVCDVGGGTTDLSLIQVELKQGEPRLTRIGVGQHLMLGGDNMDLALAHALESRLSASTEAVAPLSASRLAQLMERCRAAKELLLAADAPAQTQVTLLGAGARLIGGSRSLTLTRAEVEQLIVDGFFPQVEASEQARQARRGIVEFGLPYARDPAITRHIADFLRQHAPAVRQALGQSENPPADRLAMPDTLLLNGGVFRAGALVKRLQHTLGAWRGEALRLLHNDNPDVAVARGAVAHALAQQGLAPRIGGGAARSYFLLLDEATSRKPAAEGATRRAVCILPRGSEPGQEVLLGGRSFALRLGQPVRFHLFTALAEAARQAPVQAGELITLNEQDFAPLPPMSTVLQAGAEAGQQRQEIPVQLASALTEVGTLEMHCVGRTDTGQRWLLEFDLRQPGADAAPDEGRGATLAGARLSEAIARIDRVFGPTAQRVSPKEVRQLRAELEKTLGAREQWPLPTLRHLFDALWQRARGRRRSAEHERVWLNLAGYCLRPGFGDALDGWRLQQLWPLFVPGVQFGRDQQVCAEWWTLWRRVAGGLAAPEQLRLLDDFAYNLQSNQQGLEEGAQRPVKGSDEDMLRLGAALERIPVDYKIEIGDWLLARIQKSAAKSAARAASAGASEDQQLWALGRIGARQPAHGNSHEVVPAETAGAWVEALLALDWKRLESAAFAATQLARLSGDRARDLAPELRERIAQKLQAIHAPAAWITLLRECVPLDEATERRMLGESWPPGLKLLA